MAANTRRFDCRESPRFSFEKIDVRFASTVFELIDSSAAIARLEQPAASKRTTSSSRPERRASELVPLMSNDSNRGFPPMRSNVSMS